MRIVLTSILLVFCVISAIWAYQMNYETRYKKKQIIEINKKIVGNKGKLLSENLEVSVSFYNDSPISVELPKQVNCKIKTTDVALKGQTVSSSYKPATLDNGLNIQVPPFIESGDVVIIDTRSLEYVKKV